MLRGVARCLAQPNYSTVNLVTCCCVLAAVPMSVAMLRSMVRPRPMEMYWRLGVDYARLVAVSPIERQNMRAHTGQSHFTVITNAEVHSPFARLDEITSRYQAMEKIVKEAHEVAKSKQKLQYDRNKYDVEFNIGDKVLWHCADKLDKLQFKWHGPYKVVRKRSDVSYDIEDPLDKEIRAASVQQMIPYFGDAVECDEDDTLIDQTNVLSSLKPGHFIVFKRSDDRKWNYLHVGEVTGRYNPITHSIRVHHYVDMGPNDRSWDPAKSMQKRRVYPEYDYKGKSSTRRQAKDDLREGSTDVSFDYSLRSGPERDRITIVAKNWVLQSGGKIPADVCIRVESWLKQHKPKK